MNKHIHVESEWFFNDPVSKADFGYWSTFDCWTQEEALALSFGKDPKLVDWRKVREYELVYKYIKEYKARRILLIRAIKAGVLKRPMSPDSFVQWAELKGLSIPDELIFFVEFNRGLATLREAGAASANFKLSDDDGTAAIAAQNRKMWDVSQERGTRLRILAAWSEIELLHGQRPNAHHVLRHLKRDKDEKSISLKTVQNKLSELRRDKLIP